MPLGGLFTALFFVLAAVATIGAMVSLIEVPVAFLVEKGRMRRPTAAYLTGGVMFALGSLATLSQSPVLASVKVFGKTFFDLFDYLSSNVLLPLGGLASPCRGLAHLEERTSVAELGKGCSGQPRYLVVVRGVLKFVAPLCIIARSSSTASASSSSSRESKRAERSDDPRAGRGPQPNRRRRVQQGMAATIHTRSFDLRYSDMDDRGEATPTALLGLLEDAAFTHCDKAGWGVHRLVQAGSAGSSCAGASRWQKYPSLGKRFTVETWCSRTRLFYGERDYRIRSAEGEVLGWARSLWLFCSLERKRPVPVLEEIVKAWAPEGTVAGTMELVEVDFPEALGPRRPLPSTSGAPTSTRTGTSTTSTTSPGPSRPFRKRLAETATWPLSGASSSAR